MLAGKNLSPSPHRAGLGLPYSGFPQTVGPPGAGQVLGLQQQVCGVCEDQESDTGKSSLLRSSYMSSLPGRGPSASSRGTRTPVCMLTHTRMHPRA